MEAIRAERESRLYPERVLSERVLLTRAQRGERTAFDVLVSSHLSPLRGFLQRHLPKDVVEDVIQETFLAAWSALPGFEPRVRFKTWLYRIALHKATDWQRSHYREANVPLASETSITPLAAIEDTLAVRALLDQLSEDQRLILELYYFNDLTLAEVALVLDRNLNTVKYHFYQAHAHGLQLLQAAEKDTRS